MCSSFKEEDEHSKLSIEILNFLGMFEELFFPFLIYSMFYLLYVYILRVFIIGIRDWRILLLPHKSLWLMFCSLSLHISPATRILNENPVFWQNEFLQDN